MKTALLIIQIIISFSLIAIILLQAKGTGVGMTFGGSESFYRSKKGIEKLFVFLTIFLAILYLIFSIIQVIT